MSSEALFTKNFLLMFLANFLICAGFYMIMPVFPAYAINDLGIDKGKVGFVIGAFSLSAVVVRPFVGIALDKIGRMQVYVPALVIFALCSGGYALAASVVMLLVIRMIHGVSWSGVSTANATIVADIIPSHMRGQGMGYFGLSMTIAMALGPAFGASLMKSVGTRQIFFICMLISITALLASSFVKVPKIKTDKEPINVFTLYEKRVFGLAVMEFFFGFVYAGVLSFAALHAMDMNVEGVGYFFIVYALFVGIFRPFGGKILDKRGPSVILYSGFAFFCAGCAALAFSEELTLFLIAAALTGLGAGLIMPTIMTMMINVVSASRRGAASATVFTALDIGIGGGAMVLGIVAEKFGYLGMYLFSAAILIVPVLWFTFIEKKRYLIMSGEMREK